MRKIIIFIIIFLFTKEVFAQSKQETQDWIKEKIEGLTSVWNDSYFGTGKLIFKVQFTECKMIITYMVTMDKSGEVDTYTNEFPIKELAKPNFEAIENDYIITFRIKDNSDLIKQNEVRKSANSPTESKQSYASQRSYHVKKNLLQENLPARLTTAFSRLIQLCGGTVTKDIF